MGPADSRWITRVPRYSGFRYASARYMYAAFMLYGGTFQRFGLLPGRSPLLGESLLFSFPAGTKMFQFPALASRLCGMPSLQDGGLSHSGTRGSKVACTSPRIIAACRALHRLLEPRHPPYALIHFRRTPEYYGRCCILRHGGLADPRSFFPLLLVTSCHRTILLTVENNGFEPLTPCLQSRCSSQLS